jgi:hypothetical protein
MVVDGISGRHGTWAKLKKIGLQNPRCSRENSEDKTKTYLKGLTGLTGS